MDRLFEAMLALLMLPGCLGLAGCAGSRLPSLLPDATADRREQRRESVRQFEQQRDEARYQAALLQARQGDLAKAREMLEPLVARNPAQKEVRTLLAEILLEAQEYDLALFHARELLARSPDDAKAHHLLGMILEGKGESQEAEEHYGRAAAIDPGNEIYQLSVQSPRFSTAKASLVQDSSAPWPAATPIAAVVSDVESVSPLPGEMERSEGGVGPAAAERLAEAASSPAAAPPAQLAQLLLQAISLEPGNPQVALRAISLALRRGELDVAVDVAQTAQERFPRSAAIQRALGLAWYRKGDFQASQHALQQALSLDKSSPLTYFLMGCTLTKLAREEEAERHFAEARRRDPRFAR